MALRFHSEFSNIRRELFKIEIHDSSFSGSSTEFILRGSGFDLSYNGGEETYQLIKSSTLSFVMNIDNSTLKSLPVDIASTDSISRFAVKLYRDDTYTSGNNYTPDGSNYELYWAGVINKRIMSVQDAGYPYDFKVSAVDGIELLKNYTFKDSNGYVFESRISLKEFLLKVIDKLDFGNNFSSTDTVLATRINWYETNHSLSDSVAAETYMYQSVFNDVDDNGEPKLSTYYDVLKHLCDTFQCRFMLYEGKFWYTQFSRLKESSNSYFLYKLNGAAGSPSTLTKTINDMSGEMGAGAATGGSASTARSGFYGREKTYGKKLTSVKILWNALSDDSQNIYPLTYFPVWQMPNQGWTPYGQGEYGPNLSGYFEDGDELSFRINLNFSVTISRNNATANTPLSANQFFGRIVVPFWFLAKDNGNVFPNYRWWRGKGSGNNPNGVFYPQNQGNCVVGDWIYSGTSSNTAMKFKTGYSLINSSADTNDSNTFTFDVTIITENVPVAEVAGVFLYNDYDGNWDSALSGGDWYAVEDTAGNISSIDNWQGYDITVNYLGANSITIAPYQNGEPFVGSTFNAYVTEDSSDSTNPEELTINTIKWGDGPSSIGARTLWVSDGSNIIQSNLWQINNTGSTYKIHKLISDEILNYNWFSGERLNATIYQPPNLYESQPINVSEGFNRNYVDEDGNTVSDELFSYSSLSYNPQMASWTFKGKKISIPTPTIVTDGPNDDFFQELKPIPPIQTSVNSLNDEDESCKLNQVLSPLDTSTTSITVTGVSTDLDTSSVLLIQSCSPDRQWEKITLSSSATKNDTTLSINAFTPTFTYDETSTILVSRSTLVSSGGGGGSTSPGGSDTQVQFNNSGSFGGTDLLKITGANELTIGGTNTNTKLNAGADIILGADVAGGTSSTIQYLDSGSTNRVMLGAYATDIVVLSNRAANGIVQIRANNATAGGAGELTIATFKDTSVDFLNDAELRGTNIGNIYDTAAYLTAVDFVMSTDRGKAGYSRTNGASAQVDSSVASLFATFQVPVGYNATHVLVSGSSTSSTFNVYACDVTNATNTALTSSPSVGTDQVLSSAQAGAAGKYLVIKFSPGATTRSVYGAKITLSRI